MQSNKSSFVLHSEPYYFSRKPSIYSLNSTKNAKEIEKIYNSISNVYDSNEINQGLVQLKSVKDKISLVDILITRREEIKKAETKEKLNKLTPLLDKMKKHYLSRTFLRKKTEELDKLSEDGTQGSGSSIMVGSGISHYRRISLVGKNLIPEENSPRKSKRFSTILPKIEENIEPLKISENKNPLKNPNDSKNVLSKFEAITNSNESTPNTKRKRASMLTVVTKFNQIETEKQQRKNQLNRKNSIIMSDQKDINSKMYNTDFHLIPLQSATHEIKHKKYDISSPSLKKIIGKPHLDPRKITAVLEKELLNFMKSNKETISFDFLNLQKNDKHTNLMIIESKVKEKLKNILNKEKLNTVHSKYLFRNSFQNKELTSCNKCVKKNEKNTDSQKKSSNFIKYKTKKIIGKSMDFQTQRFSKYIN